MALLGAGAVGVVICGGPALAAAAPAGVWKIQTVAGGPGGPGPARSLALDSSCAVAFAGGHLYLAEGGDVEGGLVRRVSVRNGWLTTVAGTTGIPAADASPVPPAPDGTAANQASLGFSCGVAVDHRGNVLIADGASTCFEDQCPFPGSNLVRVVPARSGVFYGRPMRAGDIYTIAGTDAGGFSGDGGPATSAELQSPAGLAVDPAGNVVVADTGNDRLRLIAVASGTFYGQHMTAGDIYTIAGTGAGGRPLGNAGPATAARIAIAPIPPPEGQDDPGTEPAPVAAVDHHGNIVLADTGNGQVRVIVASNGRFYGRPMKAGYIYQVGGSGPGSFLNGPSGVAVDAAGNIVVSDTGGNRVKVIAAKSGRFYGRRLTAGHTYTIAGTGAQGGTGDGGPAARAELGPPLGVAVDSGGNVLITGASRVRAVAARSGRFYGATMKAGRIYTIAGEGPAGLAFPGNGTRAVRAQIGFWSMSCDRSGNVIIAAGQEHRVLVVPSVSGRFYGMAMTAGRLYSVAGGGGEPAGSGRPAAKARLDDPYAVATDHAGNILIADFDGSRVEVVAEHSARFYGQKMRAGRVYDIAGTGQIGSLVPGGLATNTAVTPEAIAVDHHGNVLLATLVGAPIAVVAAVSGRFYGQQMTAGHIYAILSGRGDVRTVAVDRAGNILFADFENAQADVLAAVTGRFYGQQMTAGHVYVIAGDGNRSPSGDGGPATQAGMAPQDVVPDAAGNVIIADAGDRAGGLVRVVAAASGTFYGQQMTAGDVYTIAGGGTSLGDGGPAVHAAMNFDFVSVDSVAVAASGAILVGDEVRIRQISP